MRGCQCVALHGCEEDDLQVGAASDDGPRERDGLAAVEHHAAQLLARVGPRPQHEGVDEVALRRQVDLLRVGVGVRVGGLGSGLVKGWGWGWGWSQG